MTGIGARFARMRDRWRMRAHRREYRRMLDRWNADGGDERLRFDYPLDERSLVLDLGGYRGQWASDVYARYRCRIAVFEPVESFAEGIRARFRHNDAIEVHAYGLGAGTRTETMHIHGAGTSAYRTNGDAAQTRIVDVAEWFDENAISSVQLMKINIEGGEFELLERLLETGLVERVDDIQVQFHNVAPDSPQRMEKIQHGLGRTHTPTYQYRFIWESWSRKRDRTGEPS